MSTGGGGLKYGAATAKQNVDFADDIDPKGTAAGYVPEKDSKKKSFLSSIKEAFLPGDSKKDQHQHQQPQVTIKPQQSQPQSQLHQMPQQSQHQQDEQPGPRHTGDLTHDGRHGGIEATMQRGHRDYDESMEGPQSHRDGIRQDGSMLEDSMPGYKDSRGRRDGGIINALKPRTSGSDDGARGGVSAFDREGAVGRQFTSEGAVGGTADKIGGPFSKDGILGRQFTDKGAVGGTVQDTLGHGDATRKGR